MMTLECTPALAQKCKIWIFCAAKLEAARRSNPPRGVLVTWAVSDKKRFAKRTAGKGNRYCCISRGLMACCEVAPVGQALVDNVSCSLACWSVDSSSRDTTSSSSSSSSNNSSNNNHDNTITPPTITTTVTISTQPTTPPTPTPTLPPLLPKLPRQRRMHPAPPPTSKPLLKQRNPNRTDIHTFLSLGSSSASWLRTFLACSSRPSGTRLVAQQTCRRRSKHSRTLAYWDIT